MKIYLLDPRSDIFQSFQDANQLYGFCNRSKFFMRGRVLVVRNGLKAKVQDLKDESPTEIFTLALHFQNELM